MRGGRCPSRARATRSAWSSGSNPSPARRIFCVGANRLKEHALGGQVSAPE